MPLTNPPVATAQNTERALRLLAAQARLYSDAKTINMARLLVAAIGAVAGAAAAVAVPQLRVSIGIISGIILLIIGVLGGARERRKVKEAASVQEELDVMLFALPWNDIHAERSSTTTIADADRRFTGNRGELRDWYPDTGTVPYPLSVLICQRSNLGWGYTLHRAWAAAVTAALLLLITATALVGMLSNLSFLQVVAALFVPQLSLIRELYETARANIDSANTKDHLEKKVLTLWRRGLDDPTTVTINDCRAVQDKILHIRQSNASIPDRFNHLFRSRQEATMRTGAAHLLQEAQERGIT